MRLGISVEGATEREFVQRVLAPHLHGFGIVATPIDMGGKVSLERVEFETRKLLGGFDRVTTLYDYYGFKRRGGLDVAGLEAAMLARVAEEHRHRVIPYVQQYEFEALVFAVPDQAEEILREVDLAPRLVRIRDPLGGAEQVNDGRDTCPSRRLKKLVGRYDKKLHGPMILHAAGLAAVRANAPRFHAWLDRLEGLATPTGGDA